MCHKTAGLVANIFEANGISSIVIGTMQSHLESAPRALLTAHNDAPIGPAGDAKRHDEVISKAVEVLRTATQRTLVRM